MMNLRKSSDYEPILEMVGMKTLQLKRMEQSPLIFFKSFKDSGP